VRAISPSLSLDDDVDEEDQDATVSTTSGSRKYIRRTRVNECRRGRNKAVVGVRSWPTVIRLFEKATRGHRSLPSVRPSRWIDRTHIRTSETTNDCGAYWTQGNRWTNGWNERRKGE